MQIKKLDHFTIIVSDLSATQLFYQGTLGMEVLERPSFDFEGMWFGKGQLQIHAILETNETGPAGLVHRPAARPSRHLHFAFQVDDFDQAVDEINLAGEQKEGDLVLDGPKARPDGVRQLFIRDPDNYVIEICE